MAISVDCHQGLKADTADFKAIENPTDLSEQEKAMFEFYDLNGSCYFDARELPVKAAMKGHQMRALQILINTVLVLLEPLTLKNLPMLWT